MILNLFCSVMAVAGLDTALATVCHDVEQFTLSLTWYDPALGGVNCDGDCGVLADALPWDAEDYGHVAACPVEWHYATLVTPLGTFLCRDTGGAITFDVAQQVVRIDVLRQEGWPWGDVALVAPGAWSLR